jgi:hypothetical protein
MANEASSLKKAAVLTGLTMVMGGAEVSETRAATQVQTFSFNFNVMGTTGNDTQTVSPGFLAFDSSKGMLTEVDIFLDSTVSISRFFNTTATISTPLFTATMGPPNPIPAASDINGPFDHTASSMLSSDLMKFMTTPSFMLTLHAINCEPGATCATWVSAADDGANKPTALTLDYVYNPVTAVPLPGALPLFATGLAGLGLLALGRRRKQNRA